MEDICEMGTIDTQAVWEVVLRIDGSDVANATAFMEAGGRISVVMGVVDHLAVRQYAEVLRFTAHLIQTAEYSEDGDAVHARGSNGNENSAIPF